ncbi:hypothetical protein [Fusobacterium sp. THCT1E2]
MKNLKSIIDNLNSADENDEVIKEALELLLDFSNLKMSIMKKEIEKNLISGNFADSNFKVPISHIISENSRQIIKNSENENTIINDVLTSLNEIFYCNKDIAGSIEKEIREALIKLIQENDKEIIFSFLVLESMSIIRYDLIFYNKSLNSKKIRDKVQSNLSYIVMKSVVNVRQMPFNDYSSLCLELSLKYFDKDINKVKNNLNEMRDAYSINNLS